MPASENPEPNLPDPNSIRRLEVVNVLMTGQEIG